AFEDRALLGGGGAGGGDVVAGGGAGVLQLGLQVEGLRERVGGGEGQRPLGGGVGRGGALRQPYGQLARCPRQFGAGHHPVDQPQFQRPLGGHRLAQQEHLGRDGGADQALQRPRRAGVGGEPD